MFTKRVPAGTRFVNISPRRSDLKNDIPEHWLQLRPNTDVSVMLGMAHTLIVKQLVDVSFLNRFTTGFERFQSYLLGKTDGRLSSLADKTEISQIQS